MQVSDVHQWSMRAVSNALPLDDSEQRVGERDANIRDAVATSPGIFDDSLLRSLGNSLCLRICGDGSQANTLINGPLL